MKKLFLLSLLFISYHTFAQDDCTMDSVGPQLKIIPLSTYLCSDGFAEVFAIDFASGFSDVCTPKDKIIFTFEAAHPILSKLNEEHYFKGKGLGAHSSEFFSGKAQKWLPQYKSSQIQYLFCTFDNNLPIKITAWDEKQNNSSGTCRLTLVNNLPLERCNFINVSVTKPDGIGLNKVSLKVNANAVEFPRFYNEFDSLLCIRNFNEPLDTKLEVNKKDDLRNGVGFKDLFAIRSHLLGIKKLDTPYKLIAADLNNDNKITAADLTLAKKIYNGTVDKIPTESWIFIDKNFIFLDPKNPWLDKNKWIQPLPKLLGNDENVVVHFIGVKLGDVDENAIP
jgi:hypothetical protein